VPKRPKPKKKCCSDKPQCKRCPLRMLAAGTLPEGYTVKKRRLVKVDAKPAKANRPKPDRLPDAA
jgi:hypothetical protein